MTSTNAFDGVNFDLVQNRRNTSSLKWDTVNESAIPMWVADMDFKCPNEILLELQAKISQGVLGYSIIDQSYFDAVANWFNQYHNTNINAKHIIPVTGVMPAIMAIVEKFSELNDSIIIQTPIYHRFFELLDLSERNIIYNPLSLDASGTYSINFENLEKLSTSKPKILMLCSPHNPVGRVWTKFELEKIGDFCQKNGVLLVVDEIHCDIILPSYSFVSFASLAPKYRDKTIILNSPTKTFNIAGLRGGNVFVFNDTIKNTLLNCFNIRGLNKLNSLFVAAARVGYTHCRYWLELLNKYIDENKKYVIHYVYEHIPQLRVTRLEGTYLLWINYQSLGVSEDQLISKLEKNLVVSRGSIFGQDGNGFIRLNIACPKQIVKQAMLELQGI